MAETKKTDSEEFDKKRALLEELAKQANTKKQSFLFLYARKEDKKTYCSSGLTGHKKQLVNLLKDKIIDTKEINDALLYGIVSSFLENPTSHEETIKHLFVKIVEIIARSEEKTVLSVANNGTKPALCIAGKGYEIKKMLVKEKNRKSELHTIILKALTMDMFHKMSKKQHNDKKA